MPQNDVFPESTGRLLREAHLIRPSAVAMCVAAAAWIALFALLLRSRRSRTHYIPPRDRQRFKHLMREPAPVTAWKRRTMTFAFTVAVIVAIFAPQEMRVTILAGLAALPPLVVLGQYALLLRQWGGYGRQQQVVELLRQGDSTQALRDAQEAIDLHGPTLFNCNSLGIIYCKLRRWDEARQVFEQAQAYKADANAKIVLKSNVAWAISHMGRAEEALAMMPDVLAAFPLEPHIRANYCEILAESGRTAEAREQLATLEDLVDATVTEVESVRISFETRIEECRDAIARCEARSEAAATKGSRVTP